MAHVALYREFRPQSFGDVVGQEHVTRTLRNALVHQRLHHAYLLSGPRGTGKTSVARILAKAVNCKQAQKGEPCNECAACQGITSGATMDVIEIDAASNRNIDDIRDLRDKVKYAPTDLTYKVYIIDEVHMLTEHAFNALLKTLEEPPAYSLFILATTDLHKVPITITSRCQRFEFHRLSGGEILKQLRAVCTKYSVKASEEALGAIARQAEGGMRDALSLLDQVMAFADPAAGVTLDDTLAVLGAAPLDQFLQLDQFVLQGDVGQALTLLDGLIRQGKDLRQFVRDYLAHLRDLLILQVDASGALLELPPQTVSQLKEQAGAMDQAQLMSAIRSLAQLEADLRFAASPRLLVEVALIRLCGPAEAAPAEAGAGQGARPAVRAVPKPAAESAAPASAPRAAGGWAPEPQAEPAATPPPAPADSPAPKGAAAERVLQVWPEVLDLIRQRQRSTRALLEHAKVGAVVGNSLLLATGAAFVPLINNQSHKGLVEKALVRVGLPMMEVRAVDENDPALQQSPGNGAEAAPEAEAKDDLVSRAEALFGKEIVKVIKEDES